MFERARDSIIVPMVSHVDHAEHDVDIIVTEVGLMACYQGDSDFYQAT